VRVALFPTCVIDAVSPEVGVAAVRVLRRLGHDVEVPAAATCCGQPAWNAGHATAAAEVARTTLDVLHGSSADVVVVPAGSCATMIRVFWRELFELEGADGELTRATAVAERTWELSELLDAEGTPAAWRPDPTSTVYHRSCHMLRELRIDEQPERVLETTGADRRPSAAGDRCCGFGGLFSIKLPEVSTAMADDVLDAAVATGAERIVGCDASCLLHLRGRAERRGLELSFRHLASVVEAASRDAG
jgi:L-lactate dehydrogenase complex protein LldE